MWRFGRSLRSFAVHPEAFGENLICSHSADILVGLTSTFDRDSQRNAIIDDGRGPQAIEISEDKEQLYVTNFLEDTVAVVDLTPGSRTENRVVLKLGRTRQSGGN